MTGNDCFENNNIIIQAKGGIENFVRSFLFHTDSKTGASIRAESKKVSYHSRVRRLAKMSTLSPFAANTCINRTTSLCPFLSIMNHIRVCQYLLSEYITVSMRFVPFLKEGRLVHRVLKYLLLPFKNLSPAACSFFTCSKTPLRPLVFAQRIGPPCPGGHPKPRTLKIVELLSMVGQMCSVSQLVLTTLCRSRIRQRLGSLQGRGILR